MKTEQGFTLIELMITVAIVAILASVALPSYTEYIRRGQVAQATEALSEAKVVMEQFYANNRTYAGAVFNGAAICSATVDTGSKTFAIGASSCDAAGFTLTATGKASMTGFAYAITQNGTKTSTFTSVPGWSNGATCWIMKKGATC